MPDPIDQKKLTELANSIKKEGKEKGLTDNQLGKRKNKHWNHVYTSLSWAFRIFLGFIGLLVAALLICYLFTIAKDPEYLKRVVENCVWDTILILATFGGEKVISKFFKHEP